MSAKILVIICILIALGTYVFLRRPQTQSNIIIINNHQFEIEYARTNAEIEHGLSGRTSLDQNRGMIFLFSQKALYRFWMKDMHFPLDMIWIDNDIIVDISANVPTPQNPDLSQLPTYSPRQPADKVLEINAGLAQKYSFQIGDKIVFPVN